ncbi:hypothetical protein M1293_01905 [Candidatus Parvarchaeota archaeon]|nr:hypothetical protein [Candidatus Parvarchaeota archaeon]
MDRRGQANIIVVIGMIAAVIFVVLNAFTYIGNISMSSQIGITAQKSIYQTLALKDYILQQSHYLFDKAQLFDGLSLTPTSINCGYINATTRLPFIPVAKVYYWHTISGQTCLPDNQEILYGLTDILNQSQFSIIGENSSDITSSLEFNMSKSPTGLFTTHFSAPFLNYTYLIEYNRTNDSVTVCNSTGPSCGSGSLISFSGPTGVNFLLEGKSFSFLPEADLISGVISEPTAVSAFFAGSGESPNSQYALVTFPDGETGIIYTNTSSSGTAFYLTPLQSQNVYTLIQAEKQDIAAGEQAQISLTNNSVFVFDGTSYTFSVTATVNGIFDISPESFAVLPLQPNFIYYKYLINQFQQAGTEDLLFPNNKPLYVSVSMFPLYNPQICVSYDESAFTLRNCLSLSGYFSDNNYLSQVMQLGAAFVNQSFPLGDTNITGFPQYSLYDYLTYVVHGVNLRTVSVNGQPKYDWYSSLLLSLGSPNGENYIIQQLSRVRQYYDGTYIYNCSYNSSDLVFCRDLLSSTIKSDLNNLFNHQMPIELSFLSGSPININVLNLSVHAEEAPSCSDYSKYNSSVSYNFSVSTRSVNNAQQSELLGIPISINFAYQNGLNLTPSENCGLQGTPYTTGYPGFNQAFLENGTAYINCAPVTSKIFLNSTCISSLETTNQAVEQTINASAFNGEYCRKVSGSSYYFCPYYKFDGFSYQNWITRDNSCPNYVVVDGDNFTSSNLNYEFISVYGGGSLPNKESYRNWTIAAINGSGIPVGQNFSLDLGVKINGPSPSFDLLLSRYSSLSDPFYIVKLPASGDTNAIYNYSNDYGEVLLSASDSGAVTNHIQNLQLNKYCMSSSSCEMYFSVNSINQTGINGDLASSLPLNAPGFIGFSTGAGTAEDMISYMFVHDLIPGYNPVKISYPAYPASNLNKDLNSSFGLSTDAGTYYNELVINSSVKPSSAYQLEVILNEDFNFGSLSNGFLKVFGVYSSGSVQQLYWWNQTPMQNGGVLWINLSKNMPSYVYIVYGNGAAYSGAMADNGLGVFPVFFSSSSLHNTAFNFFYPKDQHKYAPSYSDGSLNLTNFEPQPPYVYNSTLSKYYSQFACITTSPSLKITILNATYSPYPPQPSLDSLYHNFNPLYPDFNIIGVSGPFYSWSSVT